MSIAKTFDVVIVGAGGAGLRAAVEIPKEYSCAVISKFFPVRDDVNWMKHPFISANGELEPVINYKPVTVTKYKPIERKY
jgi:succinate dehydrogenase/fumarate reductase flavoprotein subunit